MTITKSKLNKWHNAFENLNSVLPSPQLSVGAPALSSDRSQVADLLAQLVQPGHLLLRKAVAGVFHFQQLDAMTLGAPHHQVREAHSAVSEVHGKTPAHATEDGRPDRTHDPELVKRREWSQLTREASLPSWACHAAATQAVRLSAGVGVSADVWHTVHEDRQIDDR